MIFSRSSQYALQALVLLAISPAGSYVMVRDLARRLNLPMPYMSKLMLQLKRAGILESARGRQGGYRLGVDPGKLSLMDVVMVIRGERAMQECLLGLKACSDETACAMHCGWRPVKKKLFHLLEQESLSRLAESLRRGRCQLGGLDFTALMSGTLP